MKSFLLFVAICLAALNLGNAYKDAEQMACLYDNGLNNSTDLDIMRELLKVEAKIDRDFPEDKFICAIACEFNVMKRPYEHLYDNFDESLSLDTQFSDDTKKELRAVLKGCHDNDGGDDCKLLQCVNVTRSPFRDGFVAMVRYPNSTSGRHLPTPNSGSQ